MGTTPEELAKSKDVCVVAPAGYGKTHLIAESVGCSDNGKQLILTHTHAGVRSLKDKLNELGIPSIKYHIETISGFALRYVYAYPKGSEINIEKPTETHEWNQVHEGATILLEIPAIRNVVNISYAGLYVDEYQDCTIQQHNLILKLRDILPCRILGDPLQGIFDFKGSRIVDWENDVFPKFTRLPDLEIPYRWIEKNKELGSWLIDVRNVLMKKEAIPVPKFYTGSIMWKQKSVDSNPQLIGILKASLSNSGKIVAIHRGIWGDKCHYLAGKLKGCFQSMEPIESSDLFKYANEIHSKTGENRLQVMIKFCGCCYTNIITDLKKIADKINTEGVINLNRIKKNTEFYGLFQNIINSPNLTPVLETLLAIGKKTHYHLSRKELWDAMIMSIKEYNTNKYNSLYDAAWAVRSMTRKIGRKVDYRCISRTLLIKGLEFDHAIVLDADDMNYKELYVALTRGSKSLTIISQSPILTPKYPPN